MLKQKRKLIVLEMGNGRGNGFRKRGPGQISPPTSPFLWNSVMPHPRL